MFYIKIYEYLKKLFVILFFVLNLNHTLDVQAKSYTKSKSNNILGNISIKEFKNVEKYFTLNGEANFTVDTLYSENANEKIILRLTNRKSNVDGNVAGSAFVKKKFKPNNVGDYAFSTFFRLRVTGNTVNDGSGVVFIIHSDPRKHRAMGKQPMGMGYAGDTLRGFASITPSIGIKFNVQDVKRDLDINSVGTVVNGSLKSIYPPHGYPLIAGQFNDGIPINVWINYDGDFLTVYTSRTSKFSNAILHTKRLLNLRKILNLKLLKNKASPNVYVGFSADPGFQPAYHDILEWYFHPYYRPFGDYCD
jgi:hypothetical protein